MGRGRKAEVGVTGQPGGEVSLLCGPPLSPSLWVSHQTQVVDAASLTGLAHQMRGLRCLWCRSTHLEPGPLSGPRCSSVHNGPSSHPVDWDVRALAVGRRRTAVYRGLDYRQRERERAGKGRGQTFGFSKVTEIYFLRSRHRKWAQPQLCSTLSGARALLTCRWTGKLVVKCPIASISV